MTFPSIRSRAGITAVALATLATTGAGAATVHRFAVTQGTATGSLGATTFTQSSATSGALQGEVATSPNTTIKIPFGVLGEYDSAGSTTFGIGVAGISTTGYAVGGESVGNAAGVIAINAGTGNGLEAYTHSTSSTSAAILTENTGSGPAITATGDANDGIDGYSSTDSFAGVTGYDGSPDQGEGVYGYSSSTFGIGTAGVSGTGTGLLGLTNSGASGTPSIQAAAFTAGSELFDSVVQGTDGNIYETSSLTYPSANNSGGVDNSVGASNDLQINGDVIVTGAVYSGCTSFPDTTPNSDCDDESFSTARSNNGTLVRGYNATHASATMEDEGEAQLVNGYAHVALDPTFASTISTRTPYLVFTTPQGDGPGLFITHRTANGFDVRQSLGGHASMTFDYRIVAHPFGKDGTRMAAIKPHRMTRLTSLNAKLANRLRAMHAKSMVKRLTVPHHTPRSLVSMTGR